MYSKGFGIRKFYDPPNQAEVLLASIGEWLFNIVTIS